MSKCDSCIYRTSITGFGKGNTIACFYIVHTGHRRPCVGGDDCTVYVKGEKLKAPDEAR